MAHVRLMSTAYGAPWGGIQGTGVTATGIDLKAHPKQYVVAVDPSVIPLGSKLKIPDNPFGDPNIVFTAADTGGAIKGKRLDFYDWRGRQAQMNWGTRSIVAQIVGKGSPRSANPYGGAQRPAGAPSATFSPGQPSSDLTQQPSGADIATLVQALMTPQKAIGAGGYLQDPSFTARAKIPLPQGYQPINSPGGPSPRTNPADVINQLLPSLAGAPMPADAQPKTNVTPGALGGQQAAPGVTIRGTFGGSPVAGIKPHAPTHQTEGLPGYPAFDYMGKAGTPVVAPVTGKIIKLSGHDPSQGPTEGPHGPFGWSVYVQGNDGRIYYLTHLGSRDVKLGQRVNQGSVIGSIGNYAKWGGADHVHMGVHG